jgi:hypothetical protein
MIMRLHFGATLVTAAMLLLACPPDRSFATACSPPGEVVVTDPAGDAAPSTIDIRDIAIQEVIAGLYAGKFIVTMHVSNLGSTPSGLWAVSWRDQSGNNTTTLTMNACEGVAGFGYEYNTPDSNDSGTPDGGSFDASGKIEWIVARDKIGNPGDGDTFEQIQAIAILWTPLPPLGCLPQSSNDGAGSGHYTVGSCLVDVPGARQPIALRLGLPSPNPARRDVSLALDVPSDLAGRAYEVAVFDMAGRRQSTIASGTAAAGRTMLRWNLRGAHGERVRPGTYWARITIGSERRAQTVFVVN